MRRIVEPNRITFVDRRLDWSLLLFGTSLASLAVAGAAYEEQANPQAKALVPAAGAACGAFFLSAFWFLFRKRAFVIDRITGSLTVLDRRLLRGKSFSCALEAVGVKVAHGTCENILPRGASYELSSGSIWLEIEGRSAEPFMADLGGHEAKVLGVRLAKDLGRPLHVDERNGW